MPPAAELHAFVVEDNPTICENIVGTLEELTCMRVVGTSPTEMEARQWLEAHMQDWDLLIVDLFLRGGSGMHLVQQMPARRG